MLQKAVDAALKRAAQYTSEGETATYIPELGRADPNALGVCLKTLNGECCSSGDTQTRFTMQSISKVITLAAALENCGFDQVFSLVGAEPSGESFNSLVELDLNSDRPYNPMINSGAIAVAGALVPYVTFDDMLQFSRRLCMDDQIAIDHAVYNSEMDNLSRNRAIAYLLESKGILASGAERSLMLYTKMCSLSVTAESLANLGLVLAADGCDPVTGNRLLKSSIVRTVKIIMLTCGMYDGSGTFALKVGLPSKSGVGGGLLSVADRQMGIGIYGPALDGKGNSIAGGKLLEMLSAELNLRLYS